jgi:hypothetical protein
MIEIPSFLAYYAVLTGIFVNVSEESKFLFSGLLRSTYWYTVSGVSENRISFISGLLRRTYWYRVGDVSKAF